MQRINRSTDQRINRDAQRSWDAVSAVILIVALLAVCAILIPAVLQATAKGDERPAESGERRGESSSPRSALRSQLSALRPFALHIPCRITHITDGDTLTVQVVVEARVRLLDCWAPETTGGTEASNAKGLASKEHLAKLADGKLGGLFVPFDGAKTIGDLWSFDRILGRVWVEGVGDLSGTQCLSGHAFRTKDELSKALRER